MQNKIINYSDFTKIDIRLGTIIEAVEYDKLSVVLINSIKQLYSISKKNNKSIKKIFEAITENNNGSFVNMTFLPEDCLNEINKYLKYIEDQDITLNTIETVKVEIENNYFKPSEEVESITEQNISI